MKGTEKIAIGDKEYDFIPYTPERFMKYVTEGAERFGMTAEEYIEDQAEFWEKEGRPEIAEEVRSVYRETI